jgi:hypothetical protein
MSARSEMGSRTCSITTTGLSAHIFVLQGQHNWLFLTSRLVALATTVS